MNTDKELLKKVQETAEGWAVETNEFFKHFQPELYIDACLDNEDADKAVAEMFGGAANDNDTVYIRIKDKHVREDGDTTFDPIVDDNGDISYNLYNRFVPAIERLLIRVMQLLDDKEGINYLFLEWPGGYNQWNTHGTLKKLTEKNN